MSNSPPRKRRRVGNTPAPSSSGKSEPIDQSQSKLLQFSDDVMMLILNRLQSPDLLSLSESCRRFQALCLNTESLWKDANFSNHPMDLRETKKCVKYLNSRTKYLTLEGYLKTKGQYVNISEALLSDIFKGCENLITVKLKNHFFHGEKITFKLFPKQLRNLSLAGSEVVNLPGNDQNYFKNIHLCLPKLEILDLSGCGWVSNHSLMSICKLEHLKELNLRGCFKIGECFAYTALATRFGFDSIEKFDLIDTDISITELASFGRKPTLKELLIGGQSGHKITDIGITNLTVEANSKIEKLTLLNCDITDKSLQTIAQDMKRLKYLNVSDCKNISCDGLKLCESQMELRPKPFHYCEIFCD